MGVLPASDGRTTHSGMNFTGPLSRFGNALLEMGGIRKAEMPESERGYPAEVMPLTTRIWLGARLPFCAFIAILGVFTYAYHMFPLLPWLFVLVSLMFAVLVNWPPKWKGLNKRRTLWDWAPMLFWFVAIGFGVTLGLSNYGVIEGWVNTTFLTEYSDVHFNTDPRAVTDAGILHFATGTSLDVPSSAGYKLRWDTYCAAPIVSADARAAAPVGFWAIGHGCCESRGDFTCDAASDKSARSGIPIRPHNLSPQTTESYKKAIKMAASASGLEVAKETVFVMWAKDPHNVGKAAWWTATSLFFMMSLVGLCACCACQSGLRHISEMEQ